MKRLPVVYTDIFQQIHKVVGDKHNAGAVRTCKLFHLKMGGNMFVTLGYTVINLHIVHCITFFL